MLRLPLPFKRLAACAASVALVGLLNACGSGGGGSGGGGSGGVGSTGGGAASGGGGTASLQPQPTAQDLAAADSAQLTATIDTARGNLTLSWTDTFKATNDYLILQETSLGVWTSLVTVRANDDGFPVVWSTHVDARTSFRVEAVLGGYSVALRTTAQEQQIVATPPPSSLSLALDQSEPVTRTLSVAISGAGVASGAEYYLDDALFASTTSAPSFTVSLDTAAIANGTYALRARLLIAPSTYYELRRTLRIGNAVSMGLAIPGVQPGQRITGNLGLHVGATSDFGIDTVVAAIDGVSLGSLSAPSSGPIYAFPMDTRVYGSGPHTITAQATDLAGNVAHRTLQVVFDNPPLLTLDSPVDGALVSGTVHVSGSFSTDKPGVPVTIAGYLGFDLRFTATASPFSADVSLANVPPGTYRLTVYANGNETFVDADIVVTGTPSLAYSPAFVLGAGATVLAVEGTTVLYRRGDGQLHLRTGAADVVLDPPPGTLNVLEGWRLDNGHVFAVWVDNQSDRRAVHWSPAGVVATLGGPEAQLMLTAVHWPWVLWNSYLNGGRVYTLRNVGTGQVIVPALDHGQPVSVQDPESVFTQNRFYDGDFRVGQSGVSLYYASTASSPAGIARWDQSTNSSTQIAAGALQQIGPLTDGARVAWRAAPDTNGGQPFTLMTLHIASGTQSVLSTATVGYQLADGLLVWRERTTSTGAIKVNDGVTTTTLSQRLSGRWYGTSGGRVLYQEDNKLYAWSAAEGPRLLLEVPPKQSFISNGIAYFVVGDANALYSVPLQ